MRCDESMTAGFNAPLSVKIDEASSPGRCRASPVALVMLDPGPDASAATTRAPEDAERLKGADDLAWTLASTVFARDVCDNTAGALCSARS